MGGKVHVNAGVDPGVGPDLAMKFVGPEESSRQLSLVHLNCTFLYQIDGHIVSLYLTGPDGNVKSNRKGGSFRVAKLSGQRLQILQTFK